MADDDRSLIDRCLQGQVEAFGDLVRRYQNRLYNAVFRFLGNADDARDVVQEAFLNAFRALKKFRGGSQFFTWLYRIALNHAMDLKRRAKSERAWAEAQTYPPNTELGNARVRASPEWHLQRLEEDERLQQALSWLSSEHRIVLILRDIEDMSYGQIADVLNIPIGTVRSRLHRARLELRRLLEELEKDSSGSTWLPELRR